MLESLSLALFTKQLKTRFKAWSQPEQVIELELIGAEDLGSTPRQEQFSVVFRGPLERPLPQATYRLAHPVLGSFLLFLVPIGREPAGIKYEAVFNRFVGAKG